MSQPDVIIINMHGGCPYSLFPTAIKRLSNFKYLKESSRYYTQTYSKYVLPEASLENIINSGYSNINDHIWHSWCKKSNPESSGFHIFKNAGYKTYLKGLFGLERRFNPHQSILQPFNMKTELKAYGIDEFEFQDSAFSCQSYWGHDKQVFESVKNILEEDSDSPKFIMANLYGCKDIDKISMSNRSPECEDVVVPCFDNFETNARVYDVESERCVSKSVTEDDPRNPSSIRAKDIEGLKASAILHDWLRGREFSEHDTIDNVLELHSFCWSVFELIDSEIGKLRSKVKPNTIFVFMSDQGLSLYEHGSIRNDPWETCMRGFIMLKRPYQTDGDIVDRPVSNDALFPTIASLCNIQWPRNCKHLDNEEIGCLTLSLSPSSLANRILLSQDSKDATKFRSFFLRSKLCIENGSCFTVIVWFCVNHLKMNSEEQCVKNPIIGLPFEEFTQNDLILQVYNVSQDSDELNDISMDKYWLKSEVSRELKAKFDQLQADTGFDKFDLYIPQKVYTTSPCDIVYCPFQSNTNLRSKYAQLFNEQITYELKTIKNSLNDLRKTERKSTSTQSDSIEEIILNKFGEKAVTRSFDHISDNITIFVSMTDNNIENWLILPIYGLWEPHQLKHMVPVMDINGTIHSVREMHGNCISINFCKIFLQTLFKFQRNYYYIAIQQSVTGISNDVTSTTSEPVRENPALMRARSSRAKQRRH